jgi:hypothetical protein
LLRLIVREETGQPGPRKFSRLVLLNLVAGTLGLLAFLYPIRFVRAERLREVVEGMGAAFVVLALVGLALWRVIKFLNADTETDRQD